MLSSSLCDYRNTYIIVKGTITVAQETAVAPNNANKEVISKNCALFTSCIKRINNAQVDEDQYTDVVMPPYNLI